MTGIALTPWDLATASVLVVGAGTLSLVLRLGLTTSLFIAAARTVVQLVAIGFVLEWIFGLDDAMAVGALCGVMMTAAGHAAVARSSRRYPGALWRAVLTLAVTGVITTMTVTQVVVGAEPWYAPHIVIPILGMILGNTLTGISLTLDALLERLDTGRLEIEASLALGADRGEALAGAVSDAVRRGMIPIINSMSVVGLVSLPGMMTGQLLAGADPLTAVGWQIVVMFALAASNAVATVLIANLTARRLCDGDRCPPGEAYWRQ